MIRKTLFIAALAGLAITSCQNKEAAPAAGVGVSLKPYELTYEIAKKYVKNYEKHAGYVDSDYTDQTGLNKKKRNPNSREIWFPIGRLDSLVQKIKQEKGDGIRFYLATYDTVYTQTANSGKKPAREYWGYNTLLMVSTKDSLQGKFHQDYYKAGDAASNTPSQGTILGTVPENRGEMCPPPKNCPAIGASLIQ